MLLRSSAIVHVCSHCKGVRGSERGWVRTQRGEDEAGSGTGFRGPCSPLYIQPKAAAGHRGEICSFAGCGHRCLATRRWFPSDGLGPGPVGTPVCRPLRVPRSWKWPCRPQGLAAAEAPAGGLLATGVPAAVRPVLQSWPGPEGTLALPHGAERCSVLFLLPAPTRSPQAHAAGSTARTARPPRRRSTAPTRPPPGTRAPAPRQPRRRRAPAAAPGPGPATRTTRRRSLTPTRSSCRRPRSRRSPGERLAARGAGLPGAWGPRALRAGAGGAGGLPNLL